MGRCSWLVNGAASCSDKTLPLTCCASWACPGVSPVPSPLPTPRGANLSAADLVETSKKVEMAQRLIYSGFEPDSVMLALGLPPIQHTGLPSTQLQAVAQINPADPLSVY